MNNSFDVIICNHVIEHVKWQDEVLGEISRVLKKDGICYMTCPNKIWPMEPHLKLPLLSMMPGKIADAYVRLAGKGECYDIYPMTYSKFSRKLKKLFRIENFTFEVLKNPSSYGFEGRLYSAFSISRHMPAALLQLLNHFLPNWILILRKK